MVCICLDTPMFGHPQYIWIPTMCLDTPYMFGCLPYLGCPPYLWMPPYIWTPPCLDAPLHISEFPTHICMPLCCPVHLYLCRGYLHMIWGWGHLYNHIECSEAITKIIYKTHYKFVHVGKHKYLNKTPYDLYELFIFLRGV